MATTASSASSWWTGPHFTGDPLNDPGTATTVRVRDGETLTVDGPFAETQGVDVGLHIVDFNSLDDALACAPWSPRPSSGSVEVRPVAEM